MITIDHNPVHNEIIVFHDNNDNNYHDQTMMIIKFINVINRFYNFIQNFAINWAVYDIYWLVLKATRIPATIIELIRPLKLFFSIEANNRNCEKDNILWRYIFLQYPVNNSPALSFYKYLLRGNSIKSEERTNFLR